MLLQRLCLRVLHGRSLLHLLNSSSWQMNKSRMLLGGSLLWGSSSLLLRSQHHVLLLLLGNHLLHLLHLREMELWHTLLFLRVTHAHLPRQGAGEMRRTTPSSIRHHARGQDALLRFSRRLHVGEEVVLD